MTVIWVPLIWLMVKIVMKIIPDGQKKSTATQNRSFWIPNWFHSRPQHFSWS